MREREERERREREREREKRKKQKGRRLTAKWVRERRERGKGRKSDNMYRLGTKEARLIYPSEVFVLGAGDTSAETCEVWILRFSPSGKSLSLSLSGRCGLKLRV